jgi:hypothetical protein
MKGRKGSHGGHGGHGVVDEHYNFMSISWSLLNFEEPHFKTGIKRFIHG